MCVCLCVRVVQVRSVLTTLSGDELLQLREELEPIKEPFSLVEFDDEDVDERKGDDSLRGEKPESLLDG